MIDPRLTDAETYQSEDTPSRILLWVAPAFFAAFIVAVFFGLSTMGGK